MADQSITPRYIGDPLPGVGLEDAALGFARCPSCHAMALHDVVDFAGREMCRCRECAAWQVNGWQV